MHYRRLPLWLHVQITFGRINLDALPVVGTILTSRGLGPTMLCQSQGFTKWFETPLGCKRRFGGSGKGTGIFPPGHGQSQSRTVTTSRSPSAGAGQTPGCFIDGNGLPIYNSSCRAGQVLVSRAL